METENETENVQHIKCSVCEEDITFFDESGEEIKAITHFTIERANKSFNVEDGYVEEDIDERNVKMNRFICEKCFTKILNESETLGKTFLDRKGRITGEECFIY